MTEDTGEKRIKQMYSVSESFKEKDRWSTKYEISFMGYRISQSLL